MLTEVVSLGDASNTAVRLVCCWLPAALFNSGRLYTVINGTLAFRKLPDAVDLAACGNGKLAAFTASATKDARDTGVGCVYVTFCAFEGSVC